MPICRAAMRRIFRAWIIMDLLDEDKKLLFRISLVGETVESAGLAEI